MTILLIFLKTIIYICIYIKTPFLYIIIWILLAWKEKPNSPRMQWDEKINQGEIYGPKDLIFDLAQILIRLTYFINPIKIIQFTLSYFLCVLWFLLSLPVYIWFHLFKFKNEFLFVIFIIPIKENIIQFKTNYKQFNFNKKFVKIMINRFLIIKITGISIIFINSARILNKYLWKKNLSLIEKFTKTKIELYKSKKKYSIIVSPAEKHIAPIQKIEDVKLIWNIEYIEIITQRWNIDEGRRMLRKKVERINEIGKKNIKILKEENITNFTNLLQDKIVIKYWFINDYEKLLLKNIIKIKNDQGYTHDDNELDYYYNDEEIKEIKEIKFTIINDNKIQYKSLIIERSRFIIYIRVNKENSSLASEIIVKLQGEKMSKIKITRDKDIIEITYFNKKFIHDYLKSKEMSEIWIGPISNLEKTWKNLLKNK